MDSTTILIIVAVILGIAYLLKRSARVRKQSKRR
jgi:hypothetical protein